MTLTRENFFDGENSKACELNASTKQRFDTIYKEQADASYLKANSMPKVCKGMDYTPPTVSTLKVEARHENAFVITNDAHTKQTNNGYKRGEYGGHFFCH